MVSHWGISGGRFAELTASCPTAWPSCRRTPSSEADRAGRHRPQTLKDKYGVKGPEEVTAPVGVANAYDGMHLVALAIEQAQAAEGLKIRDASRTWGRSTAA